MFLTNSDADVLIQNAIANTELAKLSKWFAANKLSLNIKKANFILFQTRNKNRYNNYTPEIKVDNVRSYTGNLHKVFVRSYLTTP
jgi:hypothetical protein